MLGSMLPKMGLSFVLWHKTPWSFSGGWDFNRNLVHIYYAMQIFNDHVSGQPLMRKHSDLDHRYMEKFNFVLWHLILGTFSGDGARGQNYIY